jgi:ubiquinone/menaquinone biosynthesis C-methylase UbiE
MVHQMIKNPNTTSCQEAHPPAKETKPTLYDRLGEKYDWFSTYEAHAKKRALELLGLASGKKVLNVGLGTGKEQQIIQETVKPGGIAMGIDLSLIMLKAAKKRGLNGLCQANVLALPFLPGTFDLLYCAYVFDLLPVNTLPGLMRIFFDILRPGGKMVILSLTEGINPVSKTIVGGWKLAYRISPWACGGCYPLNLAEIASQANLELAVDERITQLGVPSEIIQLCKVS